MIRLFSICFVLAMASLSQADAAAPPMPGNASPEARNPTFPNPARLSDPAEGTSFALVPHVEPYVANGQIVVALWFRTTHPAQQSFFARSGLTFTVTNPRGKVLAISQPLEMRPQIWLDDRGVEILNGPAFAVDLHRLYPFEISGEYSISARLVLASPKGAVLIAPPVTIQVH